MRRQFSGNRQCIGWLLSLAVLASVGGCGRTAHVAGKVTYQGQPVVHGSVILLGADNKARSGVIEPDGSYTVEGVGLGEVKIAVISRDPAKGRSVLRGGNPAPGDNNGQASPKTPPAGWFPLPPNYETPATSGLGCTIDSSQVSHDIELK